MSERLCQTGKRRQVVAQQKDSTRSRKTPPGIPRYVLDHTINQKEHEAGDYQAHGPEGSSKPQQPHQAARPKRGRKSKVSLAIPCAPPWSAKKDDCRVLSPPSTMCV